ncbi:MAG TPA: hypothetical protein VF221_02490, partial [Chloroflexota bacterium]
MTERLPQETGEETTEASRTFRHDRAKSGFAAVLRNRAFLSLWSAQILSQTAQNSLWYALIIMVGNLTGQTPAGIG